MAERLQGPSARARVVTIAGFLACATAALVVWRTSWNRAGRNDYSALVPGEAATVALDDEEVSRIAAFCGDCHGMPRPDNYPRHAWRKEVRRGYQFYVQSGRDDLDPPPMNLVLAYYQSRAPAEQVFPQAEEAEGKPPVEFTVERLPVDRDAVVPPAVADLHWARLAPDEDPVLLVCDMRHGAVSAIDPTGRPPRLELLARLNCPCHVEPCDLDGDGAVDLVVADLGNFYASDQDRGRVVWLRRRDTSGPYAEVVLASELGRVADVRPADVDGDGDLDLIASEFDSVRTGRIALLRNVSTDGEPPRFEPEEIEPREGTIHLPVEDLTGDGLLDFVALVSQEYEHVDAFINQGDGLFHLRTLWAGPDPAFGSSGLELVDLDQDGDTDVLFTNGDTFDEQYLKPCHGVQWLENLGDLRFTYHRLADLPGAYRALAGDLDLDGDLDVVVTVFVNPQVGFLNPTAGRLASIVCLEQTSPGQFVRHTLETDFPYHATFEIADFDADGDLDLAVGSYAWELTQHPPSWLDVWWNRAIVAP